MCVFVFFFQIKFFHKLISGIQSIRIVKQIRIFFWKTLLTDVWQQRKVEEIAAARRLSLAKNRGNRCCQTSVTSKNSGKSLLPDIQIFFKNVSYEYSVQYLKEI